MKRSRRSWPPNEANRLPPCCKNPCRTFAEVSYALLCTVMQFATDVTAKKQCKFKDLVPSELRTRGSWVQVLPGAPINQWLAVMQVIHRQAVATELLLRGSGASTGYAHNRRILVLANRFSCNSSFPVGPERSVVTRTASSERKLMLMDAMSEFDASNRNGRIGKRLEAFH
jgi:hypothetical protein